MSQLTNVQMSALVVILVFVAVLGLAAAPLIRQRLALRKRSQQKVSTEDLRREFARVSRLASKPTTTHRAWFLASSKRRQEIVSELGTSQVPLTPSRRSSPFIGSSTQPFELRQTVPLKRDLLKEEDLGPLALPGSLTWDQFEKCVIDWSTDHDVNCSIGNPYEAEGDKVAVSVTLSREATSESFTLAWKSTSSAAHLLVELIHELLKTQRTLAARHPSDQDDLATG